MPKSAIPVVIVCGPPGSGKSTWVKNRAKPGDRIIDFDEIKSRLSGLPPYTAGNEWIRPAMTERARMLAALSQASKGVAYFIVLAPLCADRQKWKELLGAKQIVVLETSIPTCRKRILWDARRGNKMEGQILVVEEWWRIYERDPGDHVEQGS